MCVCVSACGVRKSCSGERKCIEVSWVSGVIESSPQTSSGMLAIVESAQYTGSQGATTVRVTQPQHPWNPMKLGWCVRLWLGEFPECDGGHDHFVDEHNQGSEQVASHTQHISIMFLINIPFIVDYNILYIYTRSIYRFGYLPAMINTYQHLTSRHQPLLQVTALATTQRHVSIFQPRPAMSRAASRLRPGVQ